MHKCITVVDLASTGMHIQSQFSINVLLYCQGDPVGPELLRAVCRYLPFQVSIVYRESSPISLVNFYILSILRKLDTAPLPYLNIVYTTKIETNFLDIQYKN